MGMGGTFGGTTPGAAGGPVCYLQDDNIAYDIDIPGVTRRLFADSQVADWRRLQTMNTLVPMELDQKMRPTLMKRGHPLSNAADCYILQTGCLPWQLSFEKFKAEMRRVIAEGARNAQQGATQVEAENFEKEISGIRETMDSIVQFVGYNCPSLNTRPINAGGSSYGVKGGRWTVPSGRSSSTSASSTMTLAMLVESGSAHWADGPSR